MAKKPEIKTIASGYYSRQALNTNFENLRDKFDNTLSLDGSTPNAMGADLDMNSNDILNASEIDASSLRLGGVLVSPSAVSIQGSVAASNVFTGDGSTTVYSLSYEPFIKDNTQVYIDGVYQNKAGYNTSGTTLTFTEAPPLNSQIEVMIATTLTDVGTAAAAAVTYNQGGVGAVNTTVQAKLQETVSVKDFGAVGDGVTDDTAAIQAALNVNDFVYVPKGTYNVSSTLTFSANQQIHGTGRYSVIKSTNTSGGICMQTNAISGGNLDGLVIKDLRIQGAGSGAGGGAGLWLNDSTRWTLENVIVDQHGGDGLIVQDWAWIGQANRCQFSNNGGDGVETLMPEAGGATFSLEFISCAVSGNSGNGYNINTTPITDGNVISIIGGSVEQNTIGIKAQRTRALNIDGVYLEGNSSKGIEITGQATLGTVMIRNIGGGGLTEIDIESGSAVIDGVVVFEEGQVMHLRTDSNYDVKNFLLAAADPNDAPYIKETERRNRGVNGSGNMLRNGNFVNWGWEQDRPRSFDVLATATYARATPPDRCSGDAVEITATTNTAGLQQVISSLDANDLVTVSVWAKATSGDTAVIKTVDDGTSSQVRVVEVTSTDWKRYTLQHPLSAGSTQLTVQIYGKTATDVVYFSEVQATQMSDLKGFLTNDLDIREYAVAADIQRLDLGATPNVEGVRLCRTRDGTTVTDFVGGVAGQEITILFEHSKTITDGTNIFLAGSANFSGVSSDTLTLIQKADGNWYEKCRSVN